MIDESDPKGDVKQNEILTDLIATLKGLDEKIKKFHFKLKTILIFIK